MGSIIKELKIPNNNYSFICSNGEKIDVLKNLSKINVFVGENNSGKSRFLRSIIKAENFEFIPNNDDFSKVNEKIEPLKENFDNKIFQKCKFNVESKIPGLNSLLSQINKVDFLVHRKMYFKPILDFNNLLEELKTNPDNIGQFVERSTYATRTYNITYQFIGEQLSNIIKETFELDKPLEDINLDYDFKKLYIPILRGLRPLLEEKDYEDLFEHRTIDDYFKEYDSKRLKDLNIDLFTGLNAYHIINKYSRLNYGTKELLKEFQTYLQNNFFDGKKVEITASVNERVEQDVLTIKIGDEHEKPIYELGDGIQSIIILTLQLFLNKNKDLLVFIEEPEQCLHPGLQRKIIETFLNEKGFENFQFFITTHSNHFLDITLDFDDISIFAVKKELDDSDNKEKVPSFTIENLSEGDHSALELLGVRNSSVFLSNCTIWVEGITDRRYFRHYLELYYDFLIDEGKKNDEEYQLFKEDYHYSFVEYGGNNITHWSFLDKEEKPINVEKLCGKLFLIADKDQRKDERHKQLKESLNDRYCPLKCREVENLVSPDVLLKIVKNYEKIDEDETSSNINEDFKHMDYKNRLIGKFIEEKIIVNKEDMVRTKGYMVNSGTIKNKDSFSNKAISYIQRWDDLSSEAQEITIKIYDFIKDNNP